MPQEAPIRSQEADSYVFSRAGEAPRRFTRVFTCRRGPRRAQEADPYVFLRVFLESGRGPRRPEDAPGWPPDTCFYVFSLRVAEPPFSSYVFLRVGGSVGVVWRDLAAWLFPACWWPFGRIIRENTFRERAGRNRLSIESYAL